MHGFVSPVGIAGVRVCVRVRASSIRKEERVGEENPAQRKDT